MFLLCAVARHTYRTIYIDSWNIPKGGSLCKRLFKPVSDMLRQRLSCYLRVPDSLSLLCCRDADVNVGLCPLIGGLWRASSFVAHFEYALYHFGSHSPRQYSRP